MGAQCPPVVVLEERERPGPEEPPREYEEDSEAATRSRRAMGRCTRGAGVVGKVFLDRVAILLSPLMRERSRRNTLAWTRTTRSGARSLLVDLVACAVAVRVFGGAGVQGYDAEAASRSRRAMEGCTREAEFVANFLYHIYP